MPRWIALFIVLAVAACQSPSHVPSVSPSAASLPSPTTNATDAASPTPRPTSPFSGDAYEEWVIRSALAGFVDDVRLLYRDPDPTLIERRFTAEGLAAAKAFDWRLRTSIETNARFVGDVSMGTFSTALEDPTGDPPTLKSDVQIVVAPGSTLIDEPSGRLIEAWPERQRFAVAVTLEFDVDSKEWIVTAVGPPSTGAFDRQPLPTPAPVRCPGLKPDQADTADLDVSRPWCFGGKDGTFATDDQISAIGDYPCGTTDAAIVTVGWPVGETIDSSEHNEFVRDPDGTFDKSWLLPMVYLGRTRLPRDAYTTGLTDGEFEIWVSPSAGTKAIWAKRSTRVERWPHAPSQWGVIDCN